jgi:hypothetical protein
MFSLFKKKDKKEEKPQIGIPAHLLELRKTLYPRTSLDEFLEKVNDQARLVFPWSKFFEADQALKKNEQAKAIEALRQIVEQPGAETRILLQAWHTLAGLGVTPPEPLCGKVQGVVIEYLMQQGLDIVAGYKDHTARYYNYSGAGVVWEASDPEIDQKVDDLMTVGQAIIDAIGVEHRQPPDVPAPGVIRVYLLSCNGSSFGQGLYDQFSKDKMGGYAIQAGYSLMTALMDKQKGQQKKP